MRINPDFVETQEDQIQEKKWMSKYKEQWEYDEKNKRYIIP